MIKLIIKKYLFYIVLLLVLYYFWSRGYLNYKDILDFELKLKVNYILLSFLLSFIFILYLWILWRNLAKCKGMDIPASLYIHSISWITKYLPWKAGIFLSKIYFLTEYGVQKKKWMIISIYENIFQIVSVFFLSIPIILYYFGGILSQYYLYLSAILVIGFLIFIYPPVFYRLINFWLQFFKKDILTRDNFLSKKEIFNNIILYMSWSIINGIAFFFMIKWITDISWDLMLPMIGIWNFAWVIWLLAIFAPAGLGVREWLLIIFLGRYFPLEIATLISVFSRLWTTLADGFIGLYVLYYKFVIKHRQKN